MRNWAMVGLVALLLGMLPVQTANAQQPDKTTIVAKDGPFSSTSARQVQRFNSSVNLTPEQLAGPLTLKFYNGYSGSNQFGWVRVFFNPGRGSAPVTAQPSGLLIIDENSFKKGDIVTLDVSGRMAARNLFMIQGAGNQGAQVSYEIISTEVKGVKITGVDPMEVAPGGEITIKGAGFDQVSGSNTVKIYNRPVTVSKASPTSLEVTVPKGLQPNNYTVDVTVGGVKSNSFQFRVTGPPELGGCSQYGLVPGSTAQITGRNFAARADQNIVTIVAGDVKKKAAVTSVTKDTLTFTVPDFPELAQKLNLGVPTQANISVAANGVESTSQLNVVISIRPMSQ